MGLSCPKPEDHPGCRERLLCCFSEDAIYLQCRHHDWLQIELYDAGSKMRFDNLAAVFSEVEIPAGQDMHRFYLKPIPYMAKGEFPLHKRHFRKSQGDKK